jgi:hypothetical protein
MVQNAGPFLKTDKIKDAKG